MTGSLHIKNGTYYMVLNVYTNGKRKQKWVSTGLSAKGYNKRKADKLLNIRSKHYLLQRNVMLNYQVQIYLFLLSKKTFSLFV